MLIPHALVLLYLLCQLQNLYGYQILC